MKTLIIILIVLQVIFDMWRDAARDNHKQNLQHFLKVLNYLCFLGLGIIFYYYQDFSLAIVIIFTLFFRLLTADYIYNILVGRKFFAIGDTRRFWERFRANGGEAIKILFGLLLSVWSILRLYEVIIKLQ